MHLKKITKNQDYTLCNMLRGYNNAIYQIYLAINNNVIILNKIVVRISRFVQHMLNRY